MSAPTKDDFRQTYQHASSWPVPDRIALVQLLVASLPLDMKAPVASPPTVPENDAPPPAAEEPVPRGVPVERILARNIPTFLDDAGVDQLRWEHLTEKY